MSGPNYEDVVADYLARGLVTREQLAELSGTPPGPPSAPAQPEPDMAAVLRGVAVEKVQQHRQLCTTRRERSKSTRVHGPYACADRSGYRMTLATGEQRTNIGGLTTKAEAEQLRVLLLEQLAAPTPVTIGEALERYRAERIRQGIKPSSERTTFARLEAFFPDTSAAVERLSPAGAAELYQALQGRGAARGGTLSVATHHGALVEAKTFYAWCVRQGLCEKNPLQDVRPAGRLPRGKEQLRIAEGQRLLDTVQPRANKAEPGSVAVLLALLCGLRAGEILALRTRDVDAGDVVVARGKTAAAARRIELPEELHIPLGLLCMGRASDALLFPFAPVWVNRQTARLCKLAGVPRVTAHSLRGFHSTQALRAGKTPREVADALGHTSPNTTLQSYAQPGAAEAGTRAEVLRRLRNRKHMVTHEPTDE